MPKIVFLGAGSTIFVKNVLGDCMLTDNVSDLEIALVDIDPVRMEDSRVMLEKMKAESLRKDISIKAYNKPELAFKDANYIVNAIQVGGYDPCSIIDFEIPKKYGLRQTIADTLGIGGIFRGLRTIPVMQKYAEIIVKECPKALLINYTNPMAIISGFMQRFTPVETVGLCHSVQACVPMLFRELKMDDFLKDVNWSIAGINHQSWLLKVEDYQGKNLYPEIKKRAYELLEEHEGYDYTRDKVRLDLMLRIGYYNTESSEHTAEYSPWYIKSKYPELISKFDIPLDDYLLRCINQINNWKRQREEIVEGKIIGHVKSNEFAAYIIEAIETDKPYRIHGNVLNTGLITNLPAQACVEVPCFVDSNKINPVYVGELPEILASINRTNINVQLMTIEAAVTKRKDAVYQAAMLDPHTAAELSLDDIRSMCDELFEAHRDWLPEYS